MIVSDNTSPKMFELDPPRGPHVLQRLKMRSTRCFTSGPRRLSLPLSEAKDDHDDKKHPDGSEYDPVATLGYRTACVSETREA
jgi:hypothetical protein